MVPGRIRAALSVKPVAKASDNLPAKNVQRKSKYLIIRKVFEMAKGNGINKANSFLRLVFSGAAVFTILATVVLAYGDLKAETKNNKISIEEGKTVDNKILDKLDLQGRRQAQMLNQMGLRPID